MASGPPSATSCSPASRRASRVAAPCSFGRPPLDQILQHRYVTLYQNPVLWSPTVSTATVPTRFAGLAADSSGVDDSRAPLVLLHGLTFDRTTWRTVLHELDAVDPGRRTVAVDLPDHGESAPLPAHDLEEVAAAVHAAVEAAGLTRPVLVGHSISGVISSIYAALYPTAGVVAVDVSLRVRPFAESLAPQASLVRGT